MVTLEDPVGEARRILGRAGKTGPLRALGGVAIRMRLPEQAHPGLIRVPRDIDFFAPARAGKEVTALLVDQGYEPDREFNALHGAKRLLFYDTARGRQVDVFVGAFEMCHSIPVGPRALLEPLTLPLAELLMMKLQIVEINEKDERDAMAVLAYHPIGDDDGDMVNAAHIAHLCGSDWGLWRTLMGNLERLQIAAPRLGHDGVEAAIRASAAELTRRLVAVDKSRRWQLRNRIGDRVRWYEEPEEVS